MADIWRIERVRSGCYVIRNGTGQCLTREGHVIEEPPANRRSKQFRSQYELTGFFHAADVLSQYFPAPNKAHTTSKKEQLNERSKHIEIVSIGKRGWNDRTHDRVCHRA